MKSRQISVGLSEDHYRHLKELSGVYQVSLSALAGSMIEEKLLDKQGFETEIRIRFGNLERRMGKMAYKLARTEILLDEFLDVYLFYTHEVPKDDPARPTLYNSGKERHKKILAIVQERLKNKEEASPETEGEPKQV